MTTVAEVTLDIDAPPAEVFRYLTDPARYVRWMGSSALLEARPGGRYEVATYLPRLAAVAAGADPGPDPHSAP
jgi:uncharacterized protein YndB with AHSA1/START domain